MVDSGLNLGNDANIKQVCQTKDRNHNKVNLTNKGTAYLKLFHQNIRGLGNKPEELISHLHPDFPHVLCITEHHLKYSHLEKVHIEEYVFCPKSSCSWLAKEWDVNWWRTPPALFTQQDPVDVL
jgi:hypothetical protein